jgi:nicotinate-nucleotide pyrophosphorylase (carboxylating)
LIKDNHIKAAGSITEAVLAAKSRIPHTMMIEVETENLTQAKEAVQAGAHIIMLDNMNETAMAEAVAAVRLLAPHIVLEASGGITPERVAKVARSGVDILSVGTLTHSFQALDISLDLNAKKKGEIS